MILYIAGPMTGIPDFNYPAFDAAEGELRALGFDVRNPTAAEKHNDTGKPQAWDWYMRHALNMVLEAGGIALLPGWEDSRGATLEVTVGRALRLDIAELGVWTEPELDEPGFMEHTDRRANQYADDE